MTAVQSHHKPPLVYIHTVCAINSCREITRYQFTNKSATSSFLQIRSTIVILCIDAMVTLLSWLPMTVYTAASTYYILHTPITFTEDQVHTIIRMYRFREVTVCILLTNCFTSPIIYFCFNKPFRVSISMLLPLACQRDSNLELNKTTVVEFRDHHTIRIRLNIANLSAADYNIASTHYQSRLHRDNLNLDLNSRILYLIYLIYMAMLYQSLSLS